MNDYITAFDAAGLTNKALKLNDIIYTINYLIVSEANKGKSEVEYRDSFNVIKSNDVVNLLTKRGFKVSELNLPKNQTKLTISWSL